MRKANLPDIKMYYKASIIKAGIVLVYKLTDQWNRNRLVCGNLGNDKGVVLFKTTGGKRDFLISSIDITSHMENGKYISVLHKLYQD